MNLLEKMNGEDMIVFEKEKQNICQSTDREKQLESEIRKIQRETGKKVQDAEGRATIWGSGLAMTVAFSMFFNDALLKDAVELVTVQENL